MMILLTHLPAFVRAGFRGMPGVWKSRHQLMFCWLILMHAVFPGRKNLKELSRWTPSFVTEWRFRRLLKAGYWSIHVILDFFANEVIKTFPAPEDGVIYAFGDSRSNVITIMTNFSTQRFVFSQFFRKLRNKTINPTDPVNPV